MEGERGGDEVNARDRLIAALVLLNYVCALPPICVEVYRNPPTGAIVALTLVLAFWTWVLVEYIMWRREQQ